jgi:hypothetical protein
MPLVLLIDRALAFSGKIAVTNGQIDSRTDPNADADVRHRFLSGQGDINQYSVGKQRSNVYSM